MGIGHHPPTPCRLFADIEADISVRLSRRFRVFRERHFISRMGLLNKKEEKKKTRDDIYIEKEREIRSIRSENNGWSLFHLSWPLVSAGIEETLCRRFTHLETDLSWLVFASAIPPCVYHVDKPRLSGRRTIFATISVRSFARAIRLCVSLCVDHHQREIIRIFWTGKPSSSPRLIARWWGQEDVAPGLGVVHGSTRGSEHERILWPACSRIELVGRLLRSPI